MKTPKKETADEIRQRVLAEQTAGPLPDKKRAAVAQVRKENKKLGKSLDQVVAAFKGKTG